MRMWHSICKRIFNLNQSVNYDCTNQRIYMKLAGIVLIIIGVVALVYQGFSYTYTKKDAQIGPIEIQHQQTDTVPLPPVVGAVCIAGGAVALALGARGSRM